MAKNTVPIIIGAVLFGLLAVGLTFYVLSGAGSGGPTPSPAPTAVAQASTPAPPAGGNGYVAARTIYPRTLITDSMLVQSSNAAPGAITDKSTVVGRLANKTIPQNHAITYDAVTDPITRVVPANIAIPVGLRGVAVWVDPNQTAAGLVDVGDRVDVVAIHNLKPDKGNDKAIVGSTEFAAGRTIAQDLEVLAVDKSIQQFHPSAAPTPAPAKTAPGQPAPAAPAATPTTTPVPTSENSAQGGQANNGQNPNAVTNIRVLLAASPQDAERLVAANKLGQLHITIRNPGSHERLAIAEAREYPSYTVSLGTAARARREKLEDELRTRRYAREDKIEQYSHETQLTTMKLPPAIPSPNRMNGASGMEPSSSKDVTVIRGTEKTRVLVPR